MSDERIKKAYDLAEKYGTAERECRWHESGLDADDCFRDLMIYVKGLVARIAELEAENNRLAELLHSEKSQLEIATDLGNKRWTALNKIYEDGEKHNTNWCKRIAQEGLGIK